MRSGVYPGSFDPPTRAHEAIARAALTHLGLDRVIWVVSRVALGKAPAATPRFDDRLDVLRAVASGREWLEIRTTDAQLVADIATGHDAVVMGADKWAQVNDPVFYGNDPGLRDAALARLPQVAVAPRPPYPTPAHLELPVPGWVSEQSSTAVRSGRWEWMLDEAREFDEHTGAWSDPDRYRSGSRAR